MLVLGSLLEMMKFILEHPGAIFIDHLQYVILWDLLLCLSPLQHLIGINATIFCSRLNDVLIVLIAPLPSGIFRKNNSRMLEEIVRQQQDLLGVEGSKCNVEFLTNGTDEHQRHGKDLAKLGPLFLKSVCVRVLKCPCNSSPNSRFGLIRNFGHRLDHFRINKSQVRIEWIKKGATFCPK